VKRKDFIRLLERNSWRFLRSGGNHDVYTEGAELEAIPRHNEIKENLVKAICAEALVHAMRGIDEQTMAPGKEAKSAFNCG